MSDIGLNSNIYHSTRKYIDLLNNFLIDANYAKSKGEKYSNSLVTELFQKLINEQNKTPDEQFLLSIFNKHYKHNNQLLIRQLSRIANTLESINYDKDTLGEIEELLEVLRFHLDHSYTRIRGSFI